MFGDIARERDRRSGGWSTRRAAARTAVRGPDPRPCRCLLTGSRIPTPSIPAGLPANSGSPRRCTKPWPDDRDSSRAPFRSRPPSGPGKESPRSIQAGPAAAPYIPHTSPPLRWTSPPAATILRRYQRCMLVSVARPASSNSFVARREVIVRSRSPCRGSRHGTSQPGCCERP